MAKRNSLNRRSSRSSRYTGSAILDPDTDVVDNTYPYWWKNLENNTIARPSTDYNMLSETSQQLDSNSQVESNKAVDGWWKVLDTSNSLEDNEDNIEQSAPKNILTTSESEEETRIKKRKLSLRSKAKTHKNNAFFSILNDSERPSTSSSVLKVKKKSSIKKSESNNEEITNKEQFAEMQDSSSNQSSNLNNIVKSKPKILKKDYKNQDNNIFIDVLRNSELKVPLSRTSSISKSPKIMEQKNSSILQAPVHNRSESNEFTLSFESVHDLSHFPAPKAQSTTLEDSIPSNSTKNDSNSDTEQKIMKQKPKLLKRPTKNINKTLFKNVFIDEESNEETKRNVLASKNVVENTEIPQQSSASSLNDSHKSSYKSQENVINEDENKGTKTSAILARQNINDSIEKDFLGKNMITANDQSGDSIASSNIPSQPPISLTQEKYDLRKITNTNINVQSKSLSSLDDNIKQNNVQGRSTLDQNIINGKNVTEVHKDVAKDSNDELQVDNKRDYNSLERSTVNALLSFNEKDRDNAKNRSRLSHTTSSSTSLLKKNEYLRGRGRDVEEEISKDSSEEEIMGKYVDEVPNASQRRSVPKKSSSRSSSRNSNLTSSVNKIQDMDANTSNVNDKDVKSQHLSSISNEETVNQLEYMDKSITTLDKKSAKVSSSSQEKQHNNIDTNTLNVDKNVREVENEVSSDSSDEDIVSRFRRISQRRSVTNVLSSINKKEDSNVGTQLRSNVRKTASPKVPHAVNVADEDAREIERTSQAIGNEETPKTSQHTDTEPRSISQRKSHRASSRISNLALSTNKIEDIDLKISGVNDEKEIDNEFSSDSDWDILISRPDPSYKTSTANISSSINTKERSIREKDRKGLHIISDVTLSTKKLIHKIFSNADNKDAREREKEVGGSQAADNEKTPKKQQSISQRKSVLFNLSTKERSNAENLERASSRISNLVLSPKESTRVNTNASNIGDKDIIEAVEEASNDCANEEVPNELQQSDKNTDTFQRKSGARVSFALNKKEQDNVQNPRKVSRETKSLSSLKTPTNKDKSKSKGQMSIEKFVAWRDIVVDEERAKLLRGVLDKVKKEEVEKMNSSSKQREVKALSTERKGIINRKKSVTSKKKQVDKAYLVNGEVYKVPRLPRPKSWVTDRLYRHLWKVMEPKYKLQTRVISEKFVLQLCKVTSSIAKQKSYRNYRPDLYALMKEMARLGIIRTRNDFYNFCQKFLPYELRVKMVPMLLPGNTENIPYDPSTLHEPLLDS